MIANERETCAFDKKIWKDSWSMLEILTGLEKDTYTCLGRCRCASLLFPAYKILELCLSEKITECWRNVFCGNNNLWSWGWNCEKVSHQPDLMQPLRMTSLSHNASAAQKNEKWCFRSTGLGELHVGNRSEAYQLEQYKGLTENTACSLCVSRWPAHTLRSHSWNPDIYMVRSMNELTYWGLAEREEDDVKML